MYYTYMLRCEDNSIYTGIALDINKRMKEHFEKNNCAKYTYSHNAMRLEAVWESENKSLASKLEYRIKILSKSQKENLIKDNNLMSKFLSSKLEIENYKRIEVSLNF